MSPDKRRENLWNVDLEAHREKWLLHITVGPILESAAHDPNCLFFNSFIFNLYLFGLD